MATIDGDIYERLLPLIADHFDVSENDIELDTNVLTEFGADFTALVEFTSKIEERFGIRVPDSDACKLETVQEMVLYISKKRV